MNRPNLRVVPLAGTALLISLVTSFTGTASPDAVGTRTCVDAGVTVVVDFTDLGGEVEVGCAEGDPVSGRAALESAGFATTDSQPGMICAIRSMPDPCPEEFDGTYWAYFTAREGGEWAVSTEGADTADPARGSFEGWRYNDGSEGPSVGPTADLEVGSVTGSAPATDSTRADGGRHDGLDPQLVARGRHYLQGRLRRRRQPLSHTFVPGASLLGRNRLRAHLLHARC